VRIRDARHGDFAGAGHYGLGQRQAIANVRIPDSNCPTKDLDRLLMAESRRLMRPRVSEAADRLEVACGAGRTQFRRSRPPA
jgi:hypothetical protein